MIRALPRVWMGDKEYYRDNRLEEFRTVDNPHDIITFEEIRQAYLELISMMKYLFTPPAIGAEGYPKHFNPKNNAP
jgi:hypothetical protein